MDLLLLYCKCLLCFDNIWSAVMSFTAGGCLFGSQIKDVGSRTVYTTGFFPSWACLLDVFWKYLQVWLVNHTGLAQG